MHSGQKMTIDELNKVNIGDIVIRSSEESGYVTYSQHVVRGISYHHKNKRVMTIKSDGLFIGSHCISELWTPKTHPERFI